MSVYERVALLTGAPFLRYLQSKKESAQTLFFVQWRQRVMQGTRAVESCGRADRLYSQSLEKAVREIVRPVLEGSGYSLVDLTIARLSGSTRVNVVIYRKEGVGVDDCAAVSSMLFPRLETLEALPDPSLEVSSPGRPDAAASGGIYDFPGEGNPGPGWKGNGVGRRRHRPR